MLFWYNRYMNKTNYTVNHYTPKQGRFPVFIADNLDICDPVLAFDEIMEEIEIWRYLKPDLFSFRDTGYASLRELEDRCKVNLRYMYLMDYETPSYKTFGNFINEELNDSIEEIFKAVNEYIFEKEGVDLQHIYIDGSKFEANANKYTFVWKKGTETKSMLSFHLTA